MLKLLCVREINKINILFQPCILGKHIARNVVGC